jgi:hypothetical protein
MISGLIKIGRLLNSFFSTKSLSRKEVSTLKVKQRAPVAHLYPVGLKRRWREPPAFVSSRCQRHTVSEALVAKKISFPQASRERESPLLALGEVPLLGLSPDVSGIPPV